MNSKDYEKCIKAIWAKHERELGYPISRQLQDILEKEYRVNKDEEETLDDLDGILYQFVPLWQELLKSLLPLKGDQPAGGDSTKGKPKKIYRKCFERRFYLVDFVLDKGRNVETQRIDWKRTVMEWNKAHPSDTMSLPVLKAEYYRAMREGHLILQHIITVLLRQAKHYRHLYQEHPDAVTADYPFAFPATTLPKDYRLSLKKLNESYDEFYKMSDAILPLIPMKDRPSSTFLLESNLRLMRIVKSIQEIRLRQLKAAVRTIEATKGGKP